MPIPAFQALHITFQDCIHHLWEKNARIAESGSHGSTGWSFILFYFIFILVLAVKVFRKPQRVCDCFKDWEIEEITDSVASVQQSTEGR